MHTTYKSRWPENIPLMRHNGQNTYSLYDGQIAGCMQFKSYYGQTKGKKRIGNVRMYRVKGAMIRTLLIVKIRMIIL